MIHHKTIHFPIALLLIGAGIELLALVTKRESLESLARVFLWLGVGGLVAAVGTGLWVEESYGDARIPTHRNWGLAALGAGALAVIADLLRVRLSWARYVRAFGLCLAAVFVIVGAELGGEMGHGEDPPPRATSRKPSLRGGKRAPQGVADAGAADDDDGLLVLPPPGRIPPRRPAQRRAP